MNICVVTPCTHESESLLRTLDSVSTQTALTDPALTDPALKICHILKSKGKNHALQQLIASRAVVPNLHLSLLEEDDDGIYAALGQGFAQVQDADVYCYLGAGDTLAPYALALVSQLIQGGEEWLVGHLCGYNEHGHLIEAQVPYRFRSRLIRCGAYGRHLPFIQQESCFWSHHLHQRLDWQQLAQYKAAGDAQIWYTFAQECEPTVVECWLSGFEIREGQYSQRHADQYRMEQKLLSDTPGPVDLLLTAWDWLIWHSPRRVKRWLNPRRFIWDAQQQNYVRMDQAGMDQVGME